MGKLIIEYGDILDDGYLNWCDVIVCPLAPKVDEGLCGRIIEKSAMCEYCGAGIDIDVEPTLTKIAYGYQLPCEILFSKCSERWRYGKDEDAIAALLETYENAICDAADNGYKRILLPPLGVEYHEYTHEQVAEDVVSLIYRIVSKETYFRWGDYQETYDGYWHFGDYSGIDVKLVAPDEATMKVYQKYLDAMN